MHQFQTCGKYFLDKDSDLEKAIKMYKPWFRDMKRHLLQFQYGNQLLHEIAMKNDDKYLNFKDKVIC